MEFRNMDIWNSMEFMNFQWNSELNECRNSGIRIPLGIHKSHQGIPGFFLVFSLFWFLHLRELMKSLSSKYTIRRSYAILHRKWLLMAVCAHMRGVFTIYGTSQGAKLRITSNIVVALETWWLCSRPISCAGSKKTGGCYSDSLGM